MFWILFAGLLVVSGATFYFLMREDKIKESKQVEYQERISQLEGELKRKDKQREDLITQIKNEFSVKEQQFNAQLEESKKKLLESQEAFNKDEDKIREMEGQLLKLKKELELSTEMYDGLKVQYDDLERDMEKMQQAAMSKDAAAK